MYINLNLQRNILANLKTEEKRKVPLEHEYLDSAEYTYVLKVPDGYSVEYLPEGTTLKNKYFDSTISYELKENQIIYRHSYQLNTLLVDVAAQKMVNQLLEKLKRQYKEVVVLKKK